MSDIFFNVSLEIKDDLHLLQKYNVPCDACHEVTGSVFLLGGGGRHCIECHLKQGCRALTIRNTSIDGEVIVPTKVDIPEMTDTEIEAEFDGDVCCWGCSHCGEWIACDYGDMREHLESCEEYKQKLVETQKNG